MFRSLHPDIFIGTASDRYAGWIGSIYPKEKYQQRIERRPKVIKGKTYSEAVLPIDCLEDYFGHFSILEIDYTFYRLLTDEQGKPTPSFFLLKKYGELMKDQDFLFLKVPQIITARKIHQGPGYLENPSYLNPHIFTEHFYKPALHLLGPRIKGFVFEQEYHRQAERLPESELAESLDHFFKALPPDNRYHLELRTESYWQSPVFQVLERYGIGQVLSHWTWLPPLEKQLIRAGGRFYNSGNQAVIRLMTPLGMRYEEAYANAFPFDKIVAGMFQPRMIEETARLMHLAVKQGIQMNIIINNRSGGSAPLIARRVAEEFIKIKEK